MNTASGLDNGIEGPARWSLRLFGGFELSALPGGERVALPGKRERVLLAHLALSPKGSQPRRKLAALLWGDATDETLLDNLRACIWKLRKALGDTEHRVIASNGEDIVLDAAAFDVDALAFRRLAAQSGRSELEGAANLCSGELLDGLDIESEEFESWRRAEGARYRDQTIDVLTRLMTQLCECGEAEAAIETGTRILRLEPLHEAAIRRLMRLYGESGRRGAAIQLYRTLADALKTELDAQPEAETRAVFAELAHGGEDRTQAPVAPAAAVAPDAPVAPVTPAAADAKAAPFVSVAGPSDASRDPPPAQHPAPADGAPWQAAPQQAKARKLGWILAGTLAAVLAIFLIYQFAPPAGTTAARQQTGVEAAKAVSSSVAGTISIAVLPFANLTADPEQEFFSDGMTDEISGALAKIPDLRVVGRSSAFQFKGENKDLRAIGQALGATHLIEGSVRKAGARLRITAQLVRADNGLQVWSENYDRDLTDVFAIQEDIAKAIAGALRMPLGLSPDEHLVSNRTADPETYQQYLRAKAVFLAQRPAAAVSVLEPFVARNPDYAPAWGLLAVTYAFFPPLERAQLRRPVEEARPVIQAQLDKAEMAARKSILLDPRQVSGYLALASVEAQHKNWVAADDLLHKALALDPNDAESLVHYSVMLNVVGRSKESLRVAEQLIALEPLVPLFKLHVAVVSLVNGQNDAVISILEGTHLEDTVLARAYAATGRFSKAADAILAIPKDRYGDSGQAIEDAVRLLRSAPAKVKVPETLPALPAELSFVYAHVGAPNRVLDEPERALEVGIANAIMLRDLWYPLNAPVFKTERFKAFVRKNGMVDYWRQRGWPDRCRPMGADDFVCE
jgi:TolB-like protein/DNA-binding SARP family transcriptional activator